MHKWPVIRCIYVSLCVDPRFGVHILYTYIMQHKIYISLCLVLHHNMLYLHLAIYAGSDQNWHVLLCIDR